ncbi:TetR/AcrR family transcriptional regulator [Paenibacillus sp. NFR01]|uniref:TetR/AcrR family transcriptional regulator n=1 Tax=Paenibacillus sp. NFR01 TaxID=1566279 RepID=UPI0008B62CAD|nr:TetR/AcrR family transcriptional regulator [Paenibacillus sp. NFR01]SEU13158.1 transcriptional regulator, TetR family [Paenibacillus sp. NFR01]
MTEKINEKKEQIIKAAMQLFAVKGSSSTSMQDIAELCGISKGSLYLVFKSKEELERSLYIYCFRMISDPLLREERETEKPPRDKLRSQIEILLQHVYELREFLQRGFQELASQGRTEMPEWLKRSTVPILGWARGRLEALYGEEILPYTGELCLFARGMIHSYIWVIFTHNLPVPISRFAGHLVDMLDIAAEGLMSRAPQPLIPAAMIENWTEQRGGAPRHNPIQLIKQMRLRIAGAGSPQHEEALEALNLLENELLSLQPRKPILQGLTLLLRQNSLLAQELPELEAQIGLSSHPSCDLF